MNNLHLCLTTDYTTELSENIVSALSNHSLLFSAALPNLIPCFQTRCGTDKLAHPPGVAANLASITIPVRRIRCHHLPLVSWFVCNQ